MNKGRRLFIETNRQRSIFIGLLKQSGYLRFLNREYDSLNEVTVSYECLLCHKILARKLIVPHFRSDEEHYKIGHSIVEILIDQGEMRPHAEQEGEIAPESYIKNA